MGRMIGRGLARKRADRSESEQRITRVRTLTSELWQRLPFQTSTYGRAGVSVVQKASDLPDTPETVWLHTVRSLDFISLVPDIARTTH